MRNTFLTVPIVSALGLTLNESASDAMVGGAVTQNDKFQVKTAITPKYLGIIAFL